MNRCGSFPLLSASLAFKQTLKYLKNSRDSNEEVRKVDLADWALRTSPKFATGVKYQFQHGFLTRSEIRKSQSPFASICMYVYIYIYIRVCVCVRTIDMQFFKLQLYGKNTMLFIPLPYFNLPRIGTSTWLTPPGPYSHDLSGGGISCGSYTYISDHTRTWKASPDDWSAQFRSHPETLKTMHITQTLTHSF